MATTLDLRRIRQCTPSQLSDYYKDLLHQSKIHDVTHQSLEAIERGSIAPNTYQVWLGVSKSPSAIAQGLQQSFSVLVRKHCIQHLGKLMCSKRWKQTWEGLGGTRDLVDIFGDLSVNEVREACKALGRIGKGRDIEEKRKYITELFMGLQPIEFPDAPFKSADKRPLTTYYHYLVPSCTKEMVERILDDSSAVKLTPGLEEDLMQYHPSIIQAQQLKVLNAGTNTSNQERLKGLLSQYPQTACRNVPGFSASMQFALSTLHTLVDTDTAKVEDYTFVNELVRPLLRRAVRKKVEWSRIQEIVDLTMQYL